MKYIVSISLPPLEASFDSLTRPILLGFTGYEVNNLIPEDLPPHLKRSKCRVYCLVPEVLLKEDADRIQFL